MTWVPKHQACNSTLAVSVRSVEAGSVTSQEIALHVWCDSVYSRVDTRVYSYCRHANWTNCLLSRHLGSFTFTRPGRCFVTPVLTPLVCLRGVLAKLLSNYVYVDDRGQAVLESRVTRVLAHCYRSKGNQFRQTVEFSTKQLVLASYSLL